MFSRLSILTERSGIVGKAEVPDGGGYLKRRVDKMSQRMRWVETAVTMAGWTAWALPRYLTGNKAVVHVFFIAGLALLCVGIGIRLSKVHSY